MTLKRQALPPAAAIRSLRLSLRAGLTRRLSAPRSSFATGSLIATRELSLSFRALLRLLSRLLPSEFPFHPNWKMTETHMVYWELFPTVDHIVPIARGGADDETNWATTSMLRNSAKSNWTLEELGWQLVPAGDLREWDGLLTWFVEFLKRNQSHLADKYIRRWHRAALGRNLPAGRTGARH